MLPMAARSWEFWGRCLSRTLYHLGVLFLCYYIVYVDYARAQVSYERRPSYSRGGQFPQRPHPCEQSSCYPATGNLLVGREKQLSASSTCGLKNQERYCIVSHLEDRKKCFLCDSRPLHANNPNLSHGIENIVYREFPGTRFRSWWQSENGLENVTIQLNLEAEFHFTHLIITFKTFRPAAMLIERSFDFGATWKVYRYFAYKCDEYFPGVVKYSPRSLTDVVCESRYSNVAPSTDGEIIFRVLPPNLPIDDPYSQEVQNLLKMTNLRINFTKLHTLGDDLLDNRQEIREKYYYAITHMIVRGSCSCYGHASRCLPLPNVEPRPDMVHGRCECTHNTKGLNCDDCEDFYWDLPWRPAIGKQTNACKRCICNNHATSCHFDAAVYNASGFVSGGVCDGCLHNTWGHHCEQCNDYYYQDPFRDLSDPEICQPCDCDPHGTVNKGNCDSRTDIAADLIAGRCRCKTNIDGRRCDRCKNGFWNFNEKNPDGCEPCSCHSLGTVDNQGCNVYTGECTCKRYVTGRDCNQCLPQYYGLSEDRDGCKPCECDPGGSEDNHCDVITGQCRCRPHVAGRTCNQPEQGYYTGSLDTLVYEGELAHGRPNTQIEIREPFRDGRENTWTGTGFHRTFELSDLEFTIDDIKRSMEYDLVVRYEPQLPGVWENAQVTIKRPDGISEDGPCANLRPQDDIVQFSLPPGSQSVAVYPPLCLEAGKKYKIILQFISYNNQVETPSASVLIDSIVLIPRIESISFFRESPERQEFERYRCGQAYYNVVKGPIPDACQKYHYSIGFYVFDGADPCHCDPTGSVSVFCDSLGGACKCKPNVEGRSCDRCSAGTYGFGPEGCKACDCNSIGALDNFCDPQGHCKCRPNTYGRECDECQIGFWNFPNCQRCECNGHADMCDPRTGACISCRDNTHGYNCQSCLDGYYGDPRIGEDIPCRPCPCPGTIESGHSYATRCHLDSYTNDVICECSVGYTGARCDLCADNYFGNPETPGGFCRPCNCSNNIDLVRPGNCDRKTGHCLQCLFNTEGPNCEVCKPGFYGDAVNQQCIECVCGPLGTDKSLGPCNRETGQCHCLPNVVGQACDECEENHWKIASGTGCEHCECDPVGSLSEQCNLFDGQCDCKPGFGGRQCNQCEANFWGNPAIECHACQCNPSGSATLQCHRNNGSCVCINGIGGTKCDECAIGYIGHAPYCRPCGECFDNWYRTLNELKGHTEQIIRSASEIKQTGVTGAYTQAFEMMERKLFEVKEILDNTTLSINNISSLQILVDSLRSNLNDSKDSLDVVEQFLEKVRKRIREANYTLDELRHSSENLHRKTDDLKDRATKLQEANVEGALNLTREALKDTQTAQDTIGRTENLISEADRNYRRTEGRISPTSSQFAEQQRLNEKAILEYQDVLRDLQSKIPELNEKVCDKRGDPCDHLCGGAGCGSCGGPFSCEHGAVTKADNTIRLAMDAQEAIREKESEAEELLRMISQAKQKTIASHMLSQEAYDAAELAHKSSEDVSKQCENVTKKLENFLDHEAAKPSEIRNLAKEVLQKAINLQPEQITDLADDINKRIVSLTQIDKILIDTADNLTQATRLKERADRAKDAAEDTLGTARQAVSALNATEAAQRKAEDSVKEAKDNIDTAERDLASIESETHDAQQESNKTLAQVNDLKVSLKQLQTNILLNEREANKLNSTAFIVKNEASKAENNARELNTAYNNASSSLHAKLNKSNLAHKAAQDLLTRASKLSSDTSLKKKELKEMSDVSGDNEASLQGKTVIIDALLKRMDEYLLEIDDKAKFYRDCTSQST